jgi:hypothetical protein
MTQTNDLRLVEQLVALQRQARALNGIQKLSLLWVTLHEIKKATDLALIRINDLTFDESQTRP